MKFITVLLLLRKSDLLTRKPSWLVKFVSNASAAYWQPRESRLILAGCRALDFA